MSISRKTARAPASPPEAPVWLEPRPCSARPALTWWRLYRWASVAQCGLALTITLPPLPPSPPLGPPRGTYFSRRKLMQPHPPSPAFTKT